MFICALFLSKINTKKNFFLIPRKITKHGFSIIEINVYVRKCFGKRNQKNKRNNNKRSDQRTRLYTQVTVVVLKLSGKNRKAKSYDSKAILAYVSFTLTFFFIANLLQIYD